MKGIAVGAVAISAAWLEISGYPAGGLWFLVAAWVVLGGSSTLSTDCESCSTETDLEVLTAISVLLPAIEKEGLTKKQGKAFNKLNNLLKSEETSEREEQKLVDDK